MKTYKDLLHRADEINEIYSNHSIQYTVEYFDTSDPMLRRALTELNIPLHSKGVQMKLRNMELYGSEKAPTELTSKRIQKMKETKKQKYGDENYNNTQKAVETQLKLYGGVGLGSSIIKDKAEKTCLETYGVNNPAKSDVVKEKTRQTCLQRFGYESTFQSPEVIDKINETCLSRYNVSSRGSIPSRIEHAKETALTNWGHDNYCNRTKAKQTMYDRYGVEYALQSTEIKQHSSEVIQERYGVLWNCMREEARNYSSNNSGPNQKFEKALAQANIEYVREFPLCNYSYDFKVGNILIEINPTITHNSTWTPFGDHKGLDADYHIKKSACAIEHGYRCIHVWDWDDVNKIVSLLTKRKTLYARKCNITEIDVKTCSDFINSVHIQNYARDEFRLALTYDNEVVSVMTFGKPRYNKNYQWELIRYCSSANVVGGAQKLFSYFITKYDPDSIISYCDRSKFEGKLYSDLGFVTSNKYSPSKHWYSEKLKKHVTNNLLIKRGFDQLFGTNYGKNTSNEELMLANGFLEIYDCGQQTYTWKNIKLDQLASVTGNSYNN